jgi:pimeloyl-ACP methyl ester carboxylesterase
MPYQGSDRLPAQGASKTSHIDLIASLVDDPDATADSLSGAWRSCQQGVLEDCDLPNLSSFAAWMHRERMAVEKLRRKLAKRLVGMDGMPIEDAIQWGDAWLDDDPLGHDAAVNAVALRLKAGRIDEAEALRAEMVQRFRQANRQPPEWPDGPSLIPSEASPTSISGEDDDRALRIHQRVRFVKAKDDTCLAWATVGADGPPLVKAANWLSHMELDWESPIWSPLFRDLARDRCLVRYDERGCGLSDWDVPEISFETFVTDLETVVDAAGLDRFPLLGISQGAAVSIEYAARHPERVSHLILFGGYAEGWRHSASPQEFREREAVMVLTEAGWGRDDPTYRHLFTQTFMPTATGEELSWFNSFQRLTTSPQNAVRFLDAFSRIDVRHRLSELRTPTLVLHSRGDRRIPLNTGRALAATIPGAEFVGLDSSNHLLLGREPAAEVFLTAIRDFLSR